MDPHHRVREAHPQRVLVVDSVQSLADLAADGHVVGGLGLVLALDIADDLQELAVLLIQLVVVEVALHTSNRRHRGLGAEVADVDLACVIEGHQQTSVVPKFADTDLDWHRLHLQREGGRGVRREEGGRGRQGGREGEGRRSTNRDGPDELEVDEDLKSEVAVCQDEVVSLSNSALVGHHIGGLLLKSPLLHHRAGVLTGIRRGRGREAVEGRTLMRKRDLSARTRICSVILPSEEDRAPLMPSEGPPPRATNRPSRTCRHASPKLRVHSTIALFTAVRPNDAFEPMAV
jgi:hypothetical protein